MISTFRLRTRPFCPSWAAAVSCLAASALVSPARAQEVGQGLTQEAAVAIAMRSSPRIRAALADLAAARAEAAFARSRSAPQLSLNGFAAQSSMPNVLQSSMGVEPRALVIAAEGTFADANVTLMAPIFVGTVFSGMTRAALAAERAAAAELSGVRADVALSTREAYLRALYGAALVEAQSARVKAAEAMASIARARMEAGTGIEASLLRAEAEAADARRELSKMETERQRSVLDLVTAMGAQAAQEPNLTGALTEISVQGTLEEKLTEALSRRGELLAARSRVAEAEGRLSSAKGAFAPQVYGFAMGDVFRPADAMGRSSGGTVGITVSLPVFDGGMRRAEVVRAEAMAERARAEARTMELQVENEVRGAWLELVNASRSISSAKAAVAAAQAAYDVVAVRVESGKSILLEQIDAAAALAKARTNLAGSIYDQLVAAARLRRAIGAEEAAE